MWSLHVPWTMGTSIHLRINFRLFAQNVYQFYHETDSVQFYSIFLVLLSVRSSKYLKCHWIMFQSLIFRNVKLENRLTKKIPQKETNQIDRIMWKPHRLQMESPKTKNERLLDMWWINLNWPVFYYLWNHHIQIESLKSWSEIHTNVKREPKHWNPNYLVKVWKKYVKRLWLKHGNYQYFNQMKSNWMEKQWATFYSYNRNESILWKLQIWIYSSIECV